MSLISRIRQTLRPDAYHGSAYRPPFFEGWYFKLIDRDRQCRYAVIPGVSKAVERAESHAFVQVLDGVTGASTYHRYPFDQFRSRTDRFEISIGPNHFTPGQIELNIADPDRPISGRLHFSNLTPWPVTVLSPGIMGPFAWVPGMECYHGVVSLDHGITGSLAIGSQEVSFAGGRGYIEKDWGQAFPSAYVWMQTNHFTVPATCLTGSVAVIPWVRHSFPGFIIGLWWQQRLFRFATYTGARIEHFAYDDHQIQWSVRTRSLRLEMTAYRTAGGLLHAPTTSGMSGRVSETINASIGVVLSRQSAGRWIEMFQDTGQVAGLEAAGDLSTLHPK